MERSSSMPRIILVSALIGSITLLIVVLWPDSDPIKNADGSVSENSAQIAPPVRVENSKLNDLPFELKNDVKVKSEIIFATAVPVPGNPLSVTLWDAPQFGKISIEKYSNDGNPTGQPLESGTKVEIPNPEIPGGKIRFEIP